MASYPIRPVREDEFDAFHAVDEHAFNGSPPSGRQRSHELSRFEFDRSLAAFDGLVPVGIAGAYSFLMRVPGATAPVAGVSWVAVLPSHRRRGILTRLMRRQLTDIRARGEAVAALYASEAGIYGRFGYGLASSHASYAIRRGEGALARRAPAVPEPVRLRIAGPEQARAELAKVYDAVLETRPGFVARDSRWWDSVLFDPEEERKGASPLRCVLAEDEAGPRGYALYSAVDRWDEDRFLPDNVLTVREMLAADPAATAAIWGNLLSRDLVGEVRARLRPVDDPLPHLMADPRRLRAGVADGLWVRLTDVGAALALRRYACPVDAVIQVADDLLGENAGRWHLQGDRSSAACERTAAEADVTLGVSELGAAYLGGTRLGSLAAAGLVTEHRPGALAALSAAMSWDPAPWCPVLF
jgi:predicted acetyltransferase